MHFAAFGIFSDYGNKNVGVFRSKIFTRSASRTNTVRNFRFCICNMVSAQKTFNSIVGIHFYWESSTASISYQQVVIETSLFSFNHLDYSSEFARFYYCCNWFFQWCKAGQNLSCICRHQRMQRSYVIKLCFVCYQSVIYCTVFHFT